MIRSKLACIIPGLSRSASVRRKKDRYLMDDDSDDDNGSWTGGGDGIYNDNNHNNTVKPGNSYDSGDTGKSSCATVTITEQDTSLESNESHMTAGSGAGPLPLPLNHDGGGDNRSTTSSNQDGQNASSTTTSREQQKQLRLKQQLLDAEGPDGPLLSPPPSAAPSDNSSYTPFRELSQATTSTASSLGLGELDLGDHNSVSGSSITAGSASFRSSSNYSFSAPNSPYRCYGQNSGSNNNGHHHHHYFNSTSPRLFSHITGTDGDNSSPMTTTSSSSNSSDSPTMTATSMTTSSFSPSFSLPSTPTRRSRLPLTTPLPSHNSLSHRRSHSASSLLLPHLTVPSPEETCDPQVLSTMRLLKSIKQQIKALKRRESHLSTQLHVQRRERMQMQEDIAQMEGRRLRVEARFLRPLPLVLLLPVPCSRNHDEYDLCLVSEGDAWKALSPLIRVQLIQPPRPKQPFYSQYSNSNTNNNNNNASSSSSSSQNTKGGAALLLHFGPTMTQPMAAAVSFLAGTTSAASLRHLNLQPLVQRHDPAFWERVTCGHVYGSSLSTTAPQHYNHNSNTNNNQLDERSCQFLFDALTEHCHLWRDQLLTQVVDKKTRRIQWILGQEANALYYDAIPAAPTPNHNNTTSGSSSGSVSSDSDSVVSSSGSLSLSGSE